MPSLRRASPPEVLAPVGGRPQLRAAVENGADAVYFGLTQFNARARAANFLPEELPEVMAELHERGVQGFVTFNTLLFDEELDDAARYLELMQHARVDAAIVQDLGLAALCRRIAPDLPLHASTQMTVTSPESAEIAARLGVERVVLGRELSIRDIRRIAARTDLEVEVFVHGALCVSYSGQCFSSEAWGGRSANRGQCAQACRLPYGMVVDGEPKPMGDVRYLLSPRDLLGVNQVPALIDAGVSCLKIEGRLKGPEYVALTTRTYRLAVDRAWAGEPAELSREEREELEQVFSRGFAPGFLEGTRHQRVVRGRFPRHRGVRVGRVLEVTRRGVVVRLEGPIKPGDGVVFDQGRAEERELGGTVHEVFAGGAPITEPRRDGDVELRFGPKLRRDRLAPGDLVWRTRDPELERRLRATWEGTHRRVPVRARVVGSEGGPLSLCFTDERGRQGRAETEARLQAAERRALTRAALLESLGRLGGTPLELVGLDLELADGLFLPVSELNRLRRAAAEDLLAARRSLRVREVEVPGPTAPQRVSLGDRAAPEERRPDAPSLQLLCRTREQVEAALAIDELREIAVDFLEVKGLGEAVRAVQESGRRAVAVSPRVLKPQEENLRAFLLRLEADAVLVRSLGLLHSLLERRDEDPSAVPLLYGDFSLNATNRETVRLLLATGLTRLAPGHDLNADQLRALADGPFADRLELIVHHHLPIFHTEHCVFARFLSDGEDKRTCGAPCERHDVHLEGPDGKRHLVLADMGCRNTVFNAEAQSGARGLERFVGAGYRRFRVELVDHRPEEVEPLVRGYLDALAGRTRGRDLFRTLRADRFGATLGSLRVVDQPRPEEMKRPGWLGAD